MPSDLAVVRTARLALDRARLDLVEAEARRDLDDAELTSDDVAALRCVAARFGVSLRDAYARARELGLLSYQPDPLVSQTDRSGPVAAVEGI